VNADEELPALLWQNEMGQFCKAP